LPPPGTRNPGANRDGDASSIFHRVMARLVPAALDLVTHHAKKQTAHASGKPFSAA
jgi:hypothetical protein